MFYHIRIEIKTTNKKNDIEYLFDIENKDKIIKEIINPYKNQSQIIVNGKFIKPDKIERLQITETNNDASSLLNLVYNTLPDGVLVFYEPQDVVFNKNYFEKDITNELLQEDKTTKFEQCNISNLLHPKIAQVSLKKFLDGYYADSVESAIKEINSRLKKLYKKIKNEECDGSDLFSKVFNDDETKTLLKIADLNTISGKDEQKGYRFLFMGMWFAMRNPKAHENLNLSKEDAFDRLIFTSLLMKKIDKAIDFTFTE